MNGLDERTEVTILDEWFLAEGLTEDVAEGLPEENPKGAFNLPLVWFGFNQRCPLAQKF